MTTSRHDEEEDRPDLDGRIITFYSYKGGTGRSMAVANVAWILASCGLRVLVIDWDLEAPGLHRYFRPFLGDAELAQTPGLIDFFAHFVEAARIEARKPTTTDSAPGRWFQDRASLLRYSQTLDYEFHDRGQLDFVGAGQQSASYGTRVNAFLWGEFYEKLGGGTFLEELKQQLRRSYDYILIDSRTGLSDTSGICTVQMPDELVVCFTLNRQSIFGAAATAWSADSQRRLSDGRRGLRVWPVPTRVEPYEKERLESARAVAREQFAPFLWHMPPTARAEYWGDIEVAYFPYYAYEEVLATIADEPTQRSTMLDCMQRLTARVTGNRFTRMPSLPRGAREQLLARYRATETAATSKGTRFFISYARLDRFDNQIAALVDALDNHFGTGSAFWAGQITFGSDFDLELRRGLENANVFIVLIGPRWSENSHSWSEVHSALESKKLVVPVLIGRGAKNKVLPGELRRLRPAIFEKTLAGKPLNQFVAQLSRSLPASEAAQAPADIDDPQKGRFGGSPSDGRRQLDATVTADGDDWYTIHLAVASTGSTPLERDVEFFLHPTFGSTPVRVAPEGGQAELTLRAWGAFTVGAVTDDGRTRLELDLAQLPGAPSEFRSR